MNVLHIEAAELSKTTDACIADMTVNVWRFGELNSSYPVQGAQRLYDQLKNQRVSISLVSLSGMVCGNSHSKTFSAGTASPLLPSNALIL